MVTRLIVQSQDEFEAWLQEAVIDESMPPAARGELLFTQQGCFACHSVDGTAGSGPTMQGLAMSERTFTDGSRATADENYLRESIINPSVRVVSDFAPVMPGQYGATLTTEEIDALIAYIQEQ